MNGDFNWVLAKHQKRIISPWSRIANKRNKNVPQEAKSLVRSAFIDSKREGKKRKMFFFYLTFISHSSMSFLSA